MKAPKRAAALVLLALAVAACDDPPPRDPAASPAPPPSASTPSATLTPRALRIPRIPAGGGCPTTAPRRWSGPGVATAVLGDGPVYPVADYFRAGTVLELRPDDRGPDGSYVKKVRWIGAGYSGPVLVRAARIDGEGTASSRFSYIGEQRHGGHYAELASPTSDLPGTTTVGGPGCYVLQVDGTTFTTTVVFRAA
ncbi:hypothetical protein [Planomonospora parontospora]|uniref:hypothetical protein n=1 Tax=Planomonospora parontospora TaxID=58119 RepID=UPI00167131DF|nr:hypothetical protein [Planomonospora parontospora]GGL32896.1 hypothetical protein GCM10014719_37640 [Planomonospora parontospora subsp. antibiotica]GII17012.1 hypothetical protein Ppa05_37380 [Planomonospora parontospora subsp. antibiotica]